MSYDSILITGTSGFIGSYLSNFLVKQMPHMLIYGVSRSNPITNVDCHNNFESISCDLRSLANVKKTLPSKVDAIIHLAADARSFLTSSEASQQFLSNLTITSNLLEYAQNAQVKRFLHTSSVYIYSGNSSIPFQEDQLSLPTESLGASKLASEALVKEHALRNQFQAIAFRLFTVYGKNARKSQFLPQAIKKLLSNVDPIQFGPGYSLRDFIHIQDVASAYLAALMSALEDSFTAFNVGTGRATSIKEIVLMLSELLTIDKTILFQNHRNISDSDHQADITLIEKLLNWKPTLSLEEGLRKLLSEEKILNSLFS